MLIVTSLVFLPLADALALLSDDFNPNTSEPNPTWERYDPYDTTGSKDAGESTFTFDGTNALINVPAGLAHDLWLPPKNNNAPRLLQTVSNTDFKFEVKFETEPKVKHQMQGVIIQETSESFLRFEVFYNTSGVEVFLAHVDRAANKKTAYGSIPLDIFPKYLQVDRSGDVWTFRYSQNGTDWNVVPNSPFNIKLNVTKVGFFAGTSGSNPDFLASLDYFINLDESITDNDSWTPPSVIANPPVISTWYDYNPAGVQPGLSQKWSNILGNVSTDLNLSTLTYTLNDGPEQNLNFGGDSRRLAKEGDFNVEIDQSSLNVGLNKIEIKAKDSNDQVTTKTVTLNYRPENIWPLPYTANWDTLTNIQNVESIAHIVDGKWTLTDDGLRTDQSGYDRTVTIGDINWPSDNYEVTVPFTLHSTFAGIGFAVGWQGHDGTEEPKIEWPLQALAWVRGKAENAKLEILTYGGLSTWENVLVSKPVSITKNEPYILKSYSESISPEMSRFYVKFWKQSDTEPSNWSIQADLPSRNGSVLLVAHHVDVTFGNVSVQQASNAIDNTLPEISNIQVTTNGSTATFTWETNEPSNSVVNYGTGDAYGSNVNNSAQTTTHSLTITGLNSNTEYHFQVKSADSSNNTASSDDMTFTTKAATEDTTQPDNNNTEETDTDSPNPVLTTPTYTLPHNQWHQISLPMDPGPNNTVADIFGDDGLGTYGTTWLIFRYDTGTNSYVELKTTDIVRQGMGYWIIQVTQMEKILDMPAGSIHTPTANTIGCPSENCYEIPLATEDGTNQWSMIGYPFDTDDSFVNTRIVTTSAPCDSGCDIDTAEQNGIIHNQLWSYNGTSYKIYDSSNGSVSVWQAFWTVTLSKAFGNSPVLTVAKP